MKTTFYGIKSEYIGDTSSEFKILMTKYVHNWKEIPEIIEGVLEI